jgi:hypothetical protein
MLCMYVQIKYWDLHHASLVMIFLHAKTLMRRVPVKNLIWKGNLTSSLNGSKNEYNYY